MGIATAAWVQAVAALLTLGAALAAVRAAYRAPKLAAQFAEELRASSHERDEIVRQRKHILLVLMRNRASIDDPSSVEAINAIDMVFYDRPKIRAARIDFHTAVCHKPYNPSVAVARYLALIEQIVRDLGMESGIEFRDIDRIYLPDSMANLATLTRQEFRLRWKAAFGSEPPTTQ